MGYIDRVRGGRLPDPPRRRSMVLNPPVQVRYAAVGLAILSAIVGFSTMDFRLAGAIKDSVFFLFGGTLVVLGFVMLRKKRMIENVPSSRVRSVAMGLAELVGQVRQTTPLKAPLTGTTCAYYRFTVEKETGGKNKKWSVVEKGESTEPFWLEDETGRILVNPVGADLILRQAYRKIRRDGGIFSARRRYTEYRLIEGQRFYLLGTVGKLRDAARERQEALAARLRALKQHEQALKTFDTDGDGRIDESEWGGAVEAVKDRLLREEMASPRDPQQDVVVGKGATEETFIIADRSEASIVRHLGLQVAVAFFLGVAFTLLPTVSLLARAGALPRALAIDWSDMSISLD